MKIAVYCGSSPGNLKAYERSAQELGAWIASEGHTLVYGGARTGLMGTVADAVLAGGGKVCGVLPDVELIQNRRHPGLTEYITTPDMGSRKARMIELADAYIALPGGPGTLDELSDILSLTRVGVNSKPCVLVDTEGYYQPLKAYFEQMINAGFADARDFRVLLISDDIKEIGIFIDGSIG